MTNANTKQQEEMTDNVLVPKHLQRSIDDIVSKLAEAENPGKDLKNIAERVQLLYHSCFTKLYESFIYACGHFITFYNDHGSVITINRSKRDNILGEYEKSTEVKTLAAGASLINDKITEICFGYQFSLFKSRAVSRSFHFNSLIYINFDMFNYMVEAENCIIKKPLSLPLSDIEIINVIQSLTDMHQKAIVKAIRPIELPKMPPAEEEKW
jgi:hypothetical protein